MALAAQQQHARHLAGFTHDAPPSQADFDCAGEYTRAAKYGKELGDTDAMWDALEQATHHAVRFDQAPSFIKSDIKFMECLENHAGTSDNWGSLACQRLLDNLQEHFADFAEDERYTAMQERLDRAKRTKEEAGIPYRKA